MPSRLFPKLVCALFLLGSAAAAQTQADFKQAQALWLSEQLHRTVEAAQILASSESTTLEGCTITRIRPAATGATALSLRCPASRLPHLLLLAGRMPQGGMPPTLASSAAPRVPTTFAASLNIVHAGAALRGDWSTDFIHAQLPVVALDSGVAGAEIRVRIPQTNRIVRARILGPDSVAIVVKGA
jgi:hypothetical protein